MIGGIPGSWPPVPNHGHPLHPHGIGYPTAFAHPAGFEDPWTANALRLGVNSQASTAWQAEGQSAQTVEASTGWQSQSAWQAPEAAAAAWQAPAEENTGWQSSQQSWKGSDAGWQSSRKRSNESWESAAGADTGWQPGWQDTAEVEEDVDVDASPHGFSFLQPAPPVSIQLRNVLLAQRETIEVVVKGEAPGLTVPPVTTFAELGGVLPEYVATSLAQAGIVAPVPIQQLTLPFTLRGFDVIGIAKTGSGKTLAFLLPAIAHMERQPPMPQGLCMPSAVVLAPVRELAAQIAEEANKILWQSGTAQHLKGLGCIAVYGGGGHIRSQQLAELKKGYGQILVGTPGRMMDFMNSGDVVFDRVVFFVLDEADRMLDGGFEDQMNEIAVKVRPDRQTLFFSATWPLAVRKLAKAMCKAPPIRVSVGQGAEEVGAGPTARSDIVQEILVFDGGPRRPWSDEVTQQIADAKTEKMNVHLRTCLADPNNKVLVFVNTKNMAFELADQLQKEGFAADYMFGSRSQNERAEIVRKFKIAELKLLVTTDVMARGLDIQGISNVVVYDCYGGIDDYVHRIGRTSRGFDSAPGHALVFYEFDPKYSSMPDDIIGVLHSAGQPVPPELQQISDEVKSGERRAVHGMQKKKQKKW